MSQQLFRLLRVGILPLVLVLGACGGSDDDTPTGSLTDPDVALSSLEVVGYDIGFDPDKTGTYQIEVPNSVTTLSLTPTAGRDDLVIDTYQTSTLSEVVTETAETIESGATHQYDLAEGTNIIVVRVRDSELLLLASYTIMVDRESSTASLLSALFGNLLATENESPYFVLDPEFKSGTFDYDIEVPYENCTTYLIPYTNNASTSLDLSAPGRTSDDFPSSNAFYFDLQTGSNSVSAELTSEDGQNTATYNFTLTRAEGTDAEVAANANLASLDLNPGQINFYCGVGSYSNIFVNADVSTVEVVAQPEAANATIVIDEEAYVSGETFQLDLDDDGSTTFAIEVTSPDEEFTRTYTVSVFNTLRNVVEVETAEELQAALMNAEPNDEIRVAPGTYTGVASLATSGSDSAHFASSQSGTEEEPIYLIAQTNVQKSILSGSDASQNAVLELSGDHWVVIGLDFENALNGVVLDSANNNVLRSIEINNTGAQALVLRNGSSDNSVASARFGHTGVDGDDPGVAEAVLIGSDDSLWQSNPDAAGPYVETDNNNSIRSSMFASSIASEAIEVNEGAVGTLIEFNIFESGSLTGEAGDNSLIRVEGNETRIRYNTFNHSSDSNLDAVIAIGDASEAWHSIDWGENTEVYQNEFLLNGADVPVVSAASSATYVAENFREGEATPTYSGTGIDESSLSVPVYQFRMTSDESLCVGTGDLAVNESTTVDIAEAVACADNDPSMQWKFLNDGEGYVHIQSVADPELYFYPASSFINGCSTNSLANSVIRIFETGPEGLIYSWRIVYRGEDVLLFNKSNENFSMSAIGDQNGAVQAGSPVLMCQTTAQEFQRFQLVEQ